jgi:hypothetical protein
VKFEIAAFPTQQLWLHSSFPCTASQPQPKQTGPYFLHILKRKSVVRVTTGSQALDELLGDKFGSDYSLCSTLTYSQYFLMV